MAKVPYKPIKQRKGLYIMATLGFKIGTQTLRVTAATNALDCQADIAKVQKWLGHVNCHDADL